MSTFHLLLQISGIRDNEIEEASIKKILINVSVFYFHCLQTQLSRLIQLTSAVDAETENVARSILNDFSKAKDYFEAKIMS